MEFGNPPSLFAALISAKVNRASNWTRCPGEVDERRDILQTAAQRRTVGLEPETFWTSLEAGRDELRVFLNDAIVHQYICAIIKQIMAPDDTGAAVLRIASLIYAAIGNVVEERNVRGLNCCELARVDVGGLLVHVTGVVDDIHLLGTEYMDAAAAVVIDEIVFDEGATPVRFKRTTAILGVRLARIGAAAHEHINDDAVAVGQCAAIAAG